MQILEKKSRLRGDFRGDILAGYYAYGEISGALLPRRVSCKDARIRRMQEQCLITDAEERAYTEQLNQHLAAWADREDASLEAIWLDARRLRRAFFGQARIDAADLRDARDPGLDLTVSDIDQSAQARRLLETCRCMLFVLADARLAALMQADLQAAKALGKTVFAAYADADSVSLPSRGVLEALAPEAEAVPMSDEGEIDDSSVLSAAVGAGEACLFCYGETGLSCCRRMPLPGIVRCFPESLTARALAGQFIKTGLCTIYVPADFDILPFVPMVRRTLASYRQFSYLCSAYGEGVYRMDAEALYARWPEVFFSVYDETHFDLPHGTALPSPTGRSWYADYCSRRDEAIGALLNGIPGVQSLKGWFEPDSLTERPVPWDAPGPAEGILVHGVTVRHTESARVLLSAGSPISPRVLLQRQPEVPTLQVISNYLFFLTPRLAELYNHLRSDRPREQIAVRGGHLDYMRFRDETGKRVETFPLYRKACMGQTADGRFLFFHFRLRGGSCRINGGSVCWAETDVDPDVPGEVAVYTPYLSRSDAGAPRTEYVRPVGEGRFNFVINQTEITCARDGDVLLPGTGVVLSLEREQGLMLAGANGFTEAEDGYYTADVPPQLEVVLQNPAEIPPADWLGMQWAYGGGLTLIQDGERLFRRGNDASAKLSVEGWTSPLSAQTQESDIAALARHPRTAIGLTRQGALLVLVFSGRSAFSAGADYVEMCEIAKKLVPDVTDLMNVDGGGSAVLGIAAGRRFVEYGWPSTSSISLAGMVRPVNSLFCMTLCETAPKKP